MAVAWDEEAGERLGPLAENPEGYWVTRSRLPWNCSFRIRFGRPRVRDYPTRTCAGAWVQRRGYCGTPRRPDSTNDQESA